MQVRQAGWTVHVLGYRSATVKLTIVGTITATCPSWVNSVADRTSGSGMQIGHSTVLKTEIAIQLLVFLSQDGECSN